MYFFILILLELCLATPVYADVTLEEVYTNPPPNSLSQALIIYNSANPCYKCDQTITALNNILNTKYQNRLNTHLINIQSNPQFGDFFHIDAPLTLVIIRINDGAAFGYRKLTGLQSEIDDLSRLTERIEQFINNFLDLN